MECPSVEALRGYKPPQASMVYDKDNALLARLAPEQRIVVPLASIPPLVQNAFLAVEDRRFREHRGIDWRRVAGAVLVDLRHLELREGFSTITMQLARNVFPEHLTRARSLRRKAWEIALARRIEQTFSKDQILEMYLNQIYLGDGLYGVEAAARGYFGKPVQALSPAQAALLAALPKAPTTYNPRRNPEAAKRRRNLALGLMVEAGVLAPDKAAAAKREPLKLAPPVDSGTGAPWFVEAVRRELRERFGVDADTAGLRVRTTLDARLQAAAERELVVQILAAEKGRFGKFNHPICTGAPEPQSDKCLQGLFVALDPQTGDVRALVGGRDYQLSQFDRVTQARRQAGSAFKPFVFAAGLAAGVPVTTKLTGEDATEDDEYQPADHTAPDAPLDLRDALALSSNRAAVALGGIAGVDAVVATARSAGITTAIEKYPSMFLGAADVVPLELAAAYAPFANGGARVRPRLVHRVEDASGVVLFQQPVQREPAMAPSVAFLVNRLLTDVVNRGTGASARVEGLPPALPAAGKTGTTNDSKDLWFVGMTPDLVGAVWLGFDAPERVTRSAMGGRVAAPVWGRVMRDHYKRNRVPADWSAPPDVEAVTIDRATGQRATGVCPQEAVAVEWFLRGTEPSDECPEHPYEGVEGALHRTWDSLFGN